MSFRVDFHSSPASQPPFLQLQKSYSPPSHNRFAFDYLFNDKFKNNLHETKWSKSKYKSLA